MLNRHESGISSNNSLQESEPAYFQKCVTYRLRGHFKKILPLYLLMLRDLTSFKVLLSSTRFRERKQATQLEKYKSVVSGGKCGTLSK